MKFVSLHHHSTFSFLDGHGTPAQHVEEAAKLGMEAMALTEHGNVSSHVPLEKAAKKAGIKPIFGLEAYTEIEPKSPRKFHLTILAADQEGYRNLNRIVTRSWAEGFSRWPTVNGRMLADHHEGLIVLSGCSDSLLACSLLGGKTIPEEEASWDRAVRTARRMQDLLGDRFYLECQIFPELDRAKKINVAWERLSEITGIPLVATADVHTVRPGDHELRALLHAAGRGKNTIAQQLSSWEYDVPDYIPRSDREVFDRLCATGLSKRAAQEAARNTAIIASRCNVKLPVAARLRFPLPEGVASSKDLIWDWLREGWRYRVRQGNRHLVDKSEEYLSRLRYEMEQIEGKDFIDYFLMISDLVRFAKDSGIPVGPARGSAAASLVCYLLRITEIDPLQFPLMYFDRFIAPDREDMPDIDLDFDDDRRGEVRAYAVKMYGEDRVGNIGTFTKYKGKNSIDDVARVYEIPRAKTEELKGMVIERSGGDSRVDASLQDTFDMFPAARKILEEHPALHQAIRLEGNYRSMSTHAAGLVITNTPISDVCALYTRSNAKGEATTAVSVNKYDAEYLGLLKVDILGLSTMGMIRLALEMAGLSLEDLYRVPMNDPETLAAFRRNDVVGIFQFEGRATRLVCRGVVPDNFMELADINGLSRPGPLFSGTTNEYIGVKHGRVQASKFHPIVDKHTKFTKGQIIYQEQVLAILREFGGLPVKRVHDIRRIISQKLGEAQFNESAEDFTRGAKELHGVDESLAREVWKRLVTSATYSFCLTGDAIVKTGGASGRGGGEYRLEDLWKAYNSRTPLGEKLRYGHRGKRICLQQMDDDGRVRPKQFLSIERSKVKMPVYTVTLENGKTFTGTAMHRVLTERGYREVSELSTGDRLVCVGKPRPPRYFGPRNAEAVERLRLARAAVRERSRNRCEHCGTEPEELQYGYILTLNAVQGDWSVYDTPDNMIHLCLPCFHRFNGERGGGSKGTIGLPTELSPVVSITPKKDLEYVYMIEMRDDPHNYVANGVVHHNNIAHCISYSMLGFWCMWLKVHHPTAFYAAQLQKSDKEKWPRLIRDAEAHGIRVRGVTPGVSGITWKPNGDREVVAGWGQLNGVGPVLAERIEEYARTHPIRRSEDLLGVKGIGPNILAKFSHQIDSDDPFGLRKVSKSLNAVREAIRKEQIPLRYPTHVSNDVLDEDEGKKVIWIGMVKIKEYKDIFEDQRARTGKSIEELRQIIKWPNLPTSCVLHCYDDEEEDVYIRIDRLKFPKFKDALESIKVGHDVVYVIGKRSTKFGAVIGASINIERMTVIDPEDDS